MAEYNFTAVHRKGELNRNTDFFSRWARYKEYEDQQKAIPPVINMIIQDEAQWWKARKRCQQPGADQAAPGAGDDHGRVALAPVTSETVTSKTLTSETLAQVNAILAATGIAPMLSEQERNADDSGLHEIPLPNTLETNKDTSNHRCRTKEGSISVDDHTETIGERGDLGNHAAE